jgi:hypothetical protein
MQHMTPRWKKTAEQQRAAAQLRRWHRHLDGLRASGIKALRVVIDGVDAGEFPL